MIENRGNFVFLQPNSRIIEAMYYNRLVEKQIELKLKTLGAVVVAGPKFCGKTPLVCFALPITKYQIRGVANGYT